MYDKREIPTLSPLEMILTSHMLIHNVLHLYNFQFSILYLSLSNLLI